MRLPLESPVIWVHYLPIGTTLMAAIFALNLFKRYANRKESLHHLWWGSGAILAWRWIRWMTPFINVYSAFFLVGGAALSSWRYFKKADPGPRALGSTLIAVGAILPGIGGSHTKAGIIEALYIGEFIGIILIWSGDSLSRRLKQVP